MTEPPTSPSGVPPAPTWATVPEALRVCRHPPHLKRAVVTAVVVGTVLFAINQLNVVLADGCSLETAVKTALNYAVPFCVANVGILSACRRATGR